MTPINFGLTPLGRALRRAVDSVTFLFRDDFTTNEAAPIASPRTAEPGPGQLINLSPFSIVGNKLVQDGAGVSNGLSSVDAYNRAAGISLYGILEINRRSSFGWHTSQGNSLPADGLYFRDTSIFFRVNNGPSRLSGDTFNNSDGTDYKVFVVSRSVGTFYIIKGLPQFSEWTMIYIANASNGSPEYLNFGVVAGTPNTNTLDDARVSQLPAPWDTDYGIATDRLAGARTAGDTFTHEADALIEFEEGTIPSSGQTEFAFRMQDASNYWQVTIDSSGDIDLDEVVAGSPTQRGSSAGVIANSDRIVIICDDETIKVYDANVLRITYSSAANFKTATAGKLIDEGTGGSVSDIISWPRTLSGTAKDALDAVVDA